MNDIETYKAEFAHLQHEYAMCKEEKQKIGIMYEDALKEIEKQKSRVDFLLGQIEAYQYCIDTIRR